MGRLGRWILFGLLTATTGFLFRLAGETGSSVFHMYAWFGVLLIAFLAAYTAARGQQSRGRLLMQQRLQQVAAQHHYQLPGEFRGPFITGESLVVDGPTHYLFASSDVPNFRGRRQRKRVQRAVLTLSRWGEGMDESHLVRVLVLLRRACRDNEIQLAAEHGVILVNPEHIEADLTRMQTSL